MKRVSLLLFLLPVAALCQFNNATRIWNRAIIPDAPTNNQIYIWNATNNRWQLGSSGGGGTGCVPAGSAGQVLSDDGAGACTSNATAAGILTWITTPSSANLAAAITNETGSGLLVFATSPVLTTPNIGTPSAGVLTNATGLPISSGVSGLGTGIATFLGTPSGANLATAVTDETGSGLLVFATSPVLTTPNIGTPSAGVLTNATGLPISTGVSGLGTGVGTFLGTPSSANLATALTDETGSGLAVFGTSPTIVTPTIASFTNAGHDHSNAAGGANITSTAFATGSPIRAGSFGATFDGGGSALTAGSTTARYLVVPYACTIIGWNIEVDVGTATFKLWRIATGGTAIPTVSDSINTSGVAISSGTLVRSTTTSDFTSTAIALNDVIGVNLSAVATATLATFSVQCQK